MADNPSRRRRPDRREFLTVGMGMFVALSLPAALRRHTSLVKRTFPLMGTIAELQVAHRDERFAEDAIDAAIAELQWVERTMTRFRTDSDIGRANRGAGREGVRVNAQTAFVIAAALRAASVSDGRFDPAVGAVSELWDVLNRHEPPAGDRVQRLAARGFWRKVDVAVQSGESRVRFDDPDLHLDLGAIAKGYGIDRATDLLRARGVMHAIVTVGGDLFALGQSPEGEPWTVGIRSPHDRPSPDGSGDGGAAAHAVPQRDRTCQPLHGRRRRIDIGVRAASQRCARHRATARHQRGSDPIGLRRRTRGFGRKDY